ncbi:MAG: FHA domain-containing protein [Gammaproteobacteria bacterium PRO9]|nr:FHA domain-containing protein [Gammaproteobacteria bacterium PRO9]
MPTASMSSSSSTKPRTCSSALEELRLLSCIDTSDRRIVSIVLTGQPSLDDLLDAPGLTQLRQRARLRQRLDAMTEAETLDYIKHRLEIAGGDCAQIFEPETLPEIHRLTFGIPRLINTLCDTALTACMVEERPRVDLEMVDNVVHELRWQWFEEQGPRSHAVESGKPAENTSGNTASVMVYRAGQLLEQTEAAGFPFVIGRSNANDLVIIDKEVSRRHALIDCIGGIYVVEDLNSKNGILVNQKRRVRALLRSGDIISFGQVDVVFYLERKRAPGRTITRAVTAADDKSPGDTADDTARQALLATDPENDTGTRRMSGMS